jgi:hypothetical protein
MCWLVADPLLNLSGVLKGYRVEEIQKPDKIMTALAAYPGEVRVASIQPAQMHNYRLNPFSDFWAVQEKISRIGGYEPLCMFHTFEFLMRMDGVNRNKGTMDWFRPLFYADVNLFKMSGVTHVITYEPIQHPNLRFILEDTITAAHFCGDWRWEEKPAYLYENLHSMTRAFFVSDKPNNRIVPLNLIMPSPDVRRLSVETKDSGRVVITESYHPGWHVRTGKKRIPLKPFQGAFMVFDVSPGTHEIELVFEPTSVKIGLSLTAIGLIWILVIIVRERRRV